MIIINEDEYNLKKEEYISKMKNGAIFVYPTDTIYGIGTCASNSDSVKKIRKLKERHTKPFSIIAPSKEWIIKNCHIKKEAEEWINKLPGPYTLLLKLKKDDAVEGVVNAKLDSVGVRIPDHWISDVVCELDMPIVTTSANVADQEYMTSLDNLDLKIRNNVDFILYEGEIKGTPSTLVDLTGTETKVRKR